MYTYIYMYIMYIYIYTCYIIYTYLHSHVLSERYDTNPHGSSKKNKSRGETEANGGFSLASLVG